MENGESIISNKEMKVAIPSESEMTSGGGLARQGSIAKNNCLCSPTTHAGSFRCRLHRTPSLQRTKSIDSASASHNIKDSSHSNSNPNANPQTATNNATTIDAQ